LEDGPHATSPDANDLCPGSAHGMRRVGHAVSDAQVGGNELLPCRRSRLPHVAIKYGWIADANLYLRLVRQVDELGRGSLTNPFQYTARVLDVETSLYNYRARYYDQIGGRFISEDPVRFDGGNNFYAYARNSVVNFDEPFRVTGGTPQPVPQAPLFLAVLPALHAKPRRHQVAGLAP
jgi:RHS repeat-associated protein